VAAISRKGIFSSQANGNLLKIIALIASLGVLVFLGEKLVNAALRIARAFGVSPAVIGITVLAYGTSLPEFTVSSIAAVKQYSGLSVSNSKIESDRNLSKIKEAAVVAVLLAGVLISGNFTVDYAVKLARSAGVADWLIGATIVAAGTSLPETVV